MRIIILFLLFPASAFTQMTAFFETTLYFEDAVGNRDSVVVGHDPLANTEAGQMNTQFGEIDISNIPFDSVFEARAVHVQDFIQLVDVANSKKIIGWTTVFDNVNSCYPIVEATILLVHALHQPITVSWKKEDFIESPCRSASFISSHFLPTVDGIWFELPEALALSACLARDSTYTTYLDDYFGLDFYQIEPIEGSGIDTVYALLLYPGYVGSFESPCWGEDTVSVADIKHLDSTPTVYPNPSTGHYQLTGTATEVVKYEVLNYQGQVVLRHSSNAEIDLSGQPNGLYCLRGWLGERAFSRVLVKME